MKIYAMVAIALLLGGCASTGKTAKPIPWNRYTMGPQLDVYNPRFHNFQIINPNQVVLWQSPNTAYLMTVSGNCFFDNSLPMLRFSSGWASVQARHDVVLYNGQRCLINQIQLLNIRKMKADGLLK